MGGDGWCDSISETFFCSNILPSLQKDILPLGGGRRERGKDEEVEEEEEEEEESSILSFVGDLFPIRLDEMMFLTFFLF